MRVISIAAFALCAATSVPGIAKNSDELNLGRMTPGFSYFNRPYTNLALHDADMAACLADVANLHSYHAKMGGGAAGMGILGGLVAGAQAASADRGALAASLENCMVVRGWRVVHLDDDEGKALAALPATELRARIAPWITSEQPHGEVVRVWHNDAALAAVNHFSLHAQHTGNGQLSLLALVPTNSTPPGAAQHQEVDQAIPSKGAIDPTWPKRSLSPDTLDLIPAKAAIIVVKIKGVSLRQGTGFVFGREGPDTNIAASSVDGAPDKVTANVAGIAASSDGNFRVFAVPAGRWRIQSILNGLMELNFCLGSPAFDVGAGEVVYAGQLDLKQEKLEPNFDLASVRAWMGKSKASSIVRAAIYTHGSRGRCESSAIYALEFAEAPFAPGYALGSQVLPLK